MMTTNIMLARFLYISDTTCGVTRPHCALVAWGELLGFMQLWVKSWRLSISSACFFTFTPASTSPSAVSSHILHPPTYVCIRTPVAMWTHAAQHSIRSNSAMLESAAVSQIVQTRATHKHIHAATTTWEYSSLRIIRTATAMMVFAIDSHLVRSPTGHACFLYPTWSPDQLDVAHFPLAHAAYNVVP